MAIIRNLSDKPDQMRRDFDLYTTPLELCRAISNIVPSGTYINALDTGCSNGHFGKAFRNIVGKMTGIDIRGPNEIYEQAVKDRLDDYSYVYDRIIQQDYLQYCFDTKYDLICGNPPYKFSLEFVQKSLENLPPHGILVYLLKERFLNTKKRFEQLFTVHKPTDVWASVSRVSFYGGSSNDEEYAVYIWNKSIKPEYTRLHWLDWKKSKKGE